MTRVGITALFLVASSLIQPMGAQPGSDLMRLAVPAGQLPDGCRLRAAEGGPAPTNPALVSDPEFLGIMHALIFGPAPRTPSTTGEPLTPARARAIAIAEPDRAASVAAGYVASYQEDNGYREIGIFALRLKDAPPAASTSTRGRSTILSRGSVVIFLWHDGQAASPSRGCLEAIRRHLEAVDLR